MADKRHLAVGGYRSYGLGVAMITNPEETVHLHGHLIETEQQGILDTAKGLMRLGLENVIRFSNPNVPDSARGRPSLDALHDEFIPQLPWMRAVVDAAFSDERYVEKIYDISPRFVEIKPAPMCVEAIYKNICRSRHDKVKIANLLMGLLPDERFPEDFGEQPVNPFLQTQAPPDLTDMIASEVAQLEDYFRERGYPGYGEDN